ncbi:MAG: four helix bundle protein [Candidatus Woesearchaeota archaeon]
MGRDFKKLEIWTQAYNLVMDIYPLLESYPEYEHRNIVDQIRRAVTSLPMNIAEGAGSHSNKVFLTYLGYAYKSAKELDVLLLLSRDLGYLAEDVYDFLQKKLEEFKARLYKFMMKVEQEVVEGQQSKAKNLYKHAF